MWKWWWLYCILLHISVLASERKSAFDTPFNILFLRAFRDWTFDAFGRTGTEEKYLQIARNANKVQTTILDNVPFPCNVSGARSTEVPKSVHKLRGCWSDGRTPTIPLRPGDIDVIAVMGDSISAGAGIFADNLLQVIIENRGVTATGGGQGTWREYLTLPNIIKEFNPNLIGYALGDSLTTHKASQLNIAESGAVSADMMYMAEVLVKKIKNDPRIDVQKHWKLIVLMIGDNDFCSEMCWISSPWSILEEHKANILQVLRTLRDNLPRTFVAMVLPIHLKGLVDSREGRQSITCFLTTDFECSCMFGLAYRRFRPEYYEIMRRWQEIDMEIAAYPEFQRDDFVVVAQLTMMDIHVPPASDGYADMTYFSSDCFHLSQKGQARFANGLWNNLLESVGAKTKTWNDIFQKFLCPTLERPYLTTMLNSKEQNIIAKTAAAV